MSGGVDSTISAYLLKKSGHDIIGVHFNFVNDANKISNERNLEEISKMLGINILYKDAIPEFREKIITSFVNDYKNGITPNPCAICNGLMKFEKLIEVMKETDSDMIATGHYANVSKINNNGNIRYCIKKSKNSQKDQSYMLYRLSQEQLSHVIFPLSDMEKLEVRKIAKDLNLKVAEQKDSQDVCFIKDVDYKEFIKRFDYGDDYKERIARGELKLENLLNCDYLKKGEFVDINGKVLGFHNGIINYTIGQRKGLNIAFGERKFVVKIDKKNNQVVLGNNDDLMSDTFYINNVVFSGHDENIVGKRFISKLRYRHDGTECDIECATDNNNTYKCKLLSNVRAITNGQSAVFYDKDDNIMFGGIISTSSK